SCRPLPPPPYGAPLPSTTLCRAARHGDLPLQEGDLRLEVLDLFFVPRPARPSIVTSGHAPSPPREESRRPTQTLPIWRASATCPYGVRVLRGRSGRVGRGAVGTARGEGLRVVVLGGLCRSDGVTVGLACLVR